MTKAVRGVFAPVTAFAFSSGQLEECRDFLAKRTANTECVPMVDEAQILMRADGRLAETGYRFNALGFASLAQVLAYGLNPLFNELSGENGRLSAQGAAASDIAAAVSVYNTTVRVRFDAVRERTLLVDHREQTIDGFLGLTHRLLDNSRFLEIVSDELMTAQPEAQFSRAELIGRELRLFFILPKSRRNDIYTDPRHTFASGWFFSNREDTGLAINATTCLFTQFGVAVTPTASNLRLNHIGADLEGRTGALVARAAQNVIDMDVIAARVRALCQKSLGFTEDKAGFDAALDNCATLLLKMRVSRDVATRIARATATAGADLEPRAALEVYTKAALTERTLYDLCCSVLRYARHQHHTVRDVLQHGAMSMLIPEPRVKKRK